jgi:hypothetical protein
MGNNKKSPRNTWHENSQFVPNENICMTFEMPGLYGLDYKALGSFNPETNFLSILSVSMSRLPIDRQLSLRYTLYR